MSTSIPVYDICSLSSNKPEQHDILVSRLSHYLVTHPNLKFPHRHSFYHLVLFTKGEGTYEIDFVKCTVSPSQMYFMVPGQVHSWDLTGDTDGYIINFSSSFFHSFLLSPEYLKQFSFLSGIVDGSIITLPENLRQEITAVFESIIEEAQLKHRVNRDMIRVLLLQIFLTINKHLGSRPEQKVTGSKVILIRNFQNLVEQHFHRLRLPRDYATLLYITPNHLNALSKDILGKPAGEVIRERVLLEAKRRLIDFDLTISEVAFQLGFNDNSYFTKFFKKYGGITPEEFREKHS
ncbi:AraC family transcriptional regulator [Pontibacter sp. FD36]|uniref:AraC family transcriptional regulator n=1 Tax=Pontibacter sp. FD36 TaxID=2789860 RepID=UPI0018AA564D|nr:helix-turn-helix transcriptional regulator [Pontibacter sp. FD36]MBF8961710.1 AraC family transcriptional regulator [Pontibacter sp. FD36]